MKRRRTYPDWYRLTEKGIAAVIAAVRNSEQ